MSSFKHSPWILVVDLSLLSAFVTAAIYGMGWVLVMIGIAMWALNIRFMRHKEKVMSDEGTAVSPQSISFMVFEDRHGNHQIVAEKGARTLRVKVRHETRASFSELSTMQAVREIIQTLERETTNAK